MDIIIIITSSIIILLIIFCSWNIVYDNYTNIKDTHDLFILNKSTRDATTIEVNTFVNLINSEITTMNSDLTWINNELSKTTLPPAETRIAALERKLEKLFPTGNKGLTLYTTAGVAKSIDYSHLGMLTGENTFKLLNVSANKYFRRATGTNQFSYGTAGIVPPTAEPNFVFNMETS
jgi:hypothetical protein